LTRHSPRDYSEGMHLKKVRIQNYRSIKDETIALDRYTCLVGPNGVGKSNVLRALCVFFRADASPVGTEHLAKEDFHHGDTATPVTITLTFDGLSPDAKMDLADYVRHDQLIVSAVATWDAATEKAPIVQHGSRLGVAAFRPFFAKEKDKETVEALKEEYKKLQTSFKLPDVATKPKMLEALRTYEAEHAAECSEIASRDQFYGFSKGENRLRKYVQFLYVPAVKDATSEQQEEKDSVISQLLERAVKSSVLFAEELKKIGTTAREGYRSMLAEKQSALDDLSKTLTERIKEWATPDTELALHWGHAGEDPLKIAPPIAQVVAGQAGFNGQLFRMGHGLQRSFLLAILQVLATAPAGASPTLVLAIEEPELYQHPPQIRHLASVLGDLAAGDAQVVLSTHSPLLITGREFQSVRLARRLNNGPTQFRTATVEAVSEAIAKARGDKPSGVAGRTAKLHESLQPGLSEMFFCERLVLVEGTSDRAYILASMELLGKWSQLRRLGIHVVPAEGKSHLIQPLAIAHALGIPTFVAFDGDSTQAAKTPDKKVMHEKDNRTLLGLSGNGALPAHPWISAHHKNCTMWGDTIEAAVKQSMDPGKYDSIRNKVLVEFDQEPDLGKDTLYVYRLLEEFDAQKAWPAVLTQLCDSILAAFP